MADDLDINKNDFKEKINCVLKEKNNELIKIFLSNFRNEDELADL